MLKKGDLVHIIAPSGFVDPSRLDNGIKVLKDWGLTAVEGKHLRSQSGYFSGTDEQRLEDLVYALTNSEVKAIFCARGGYGLSRLMPLLPEKIQSITPKALIGFSDITLLHQKLSTISEISKIHACMVAQYGNAEYKNSVSALRDLLFTGSISYTISNVPYTFPETGIITGGNLRMLVDTLGTAEEINTQDKILLIEEIGEGLYKLDRLMMHLARAGKLEPLKGVFLGHITNAEDSTPPFGKDATEVIVSILAKYNVPVVTGFPGGHEAPNFPVVLEKKFSLQRKGNKAEIHFSL